MNQDRTRAVWQLLASIADWEPTPKISSARGALPGEIGTIRQECSGCDGLGRLKGGGACRRCHGKGHVFVDPQTRNHAPGVPDPNDFTLDQGDLARSIRWRRVRCDRCGGTGCDRCARTGTVDTIDTRLEHASLRRTQREWGSSPTAPEWWLSQALNRKQALFRTGSYPELERLLDQLRDRSPAAYALLDVHVIHPIGVRMGPRRQAHLDVAVAWLAERMPYRIMVPDHARQWSPAKRDMLWHGKTGWHKTVKAQRDRDLRTMHQAGVPVHELQALSGLSRARVYELVRDPVASAVA